MSKQIFGRFGINNEENFYKYCKIKILFTFQCGNSNVPLNKADFFKYIQFFIN